MPERLFDVDYSRVVYDRNGELLGARVSIDGQWRFEPSLVIPEKFKSCLIHFEDKRFYHHFGIDVISIASAIRQNFKAKKIVRGASTIPMQIMRLASNHQKRSFWNKINESILATRIEFKYSKEELLCIYAGHAPFGGNVVGLEAASWRYFSKAPNLLSWAESATLAVLPNAPALIHPGRNRDALLKKRNRLLTILLKENVIDQEEFDLALLEPIPLRPHQLPSITPHLLNRSHLYPEPRFFTTIDKEIQQIVIEVAHNRYNNLEGNGIYNMAVLILDTKTNQVLAYLGNAPNAKHEEAIDMVVQNRSTGSLLKPLLFAHCIQDKLIWPSSFVDDVPLYLDGFHPENYDRNYRGLVPANEALIQSLNVPFVSLLKEYGIDKFLSKLKKHKLLGINKSADHYGLSLILGGAESSLWELCGAYASMGRVLLDYHSKQSKYAEVASSLPVIRLNEGLKYNYQFNSKLLSAGSIWHTFEALKRLKRPNQDGNWEAFDSSIPIAWKTGTSFGHRDAWAIGVSPKLTIGVWVGNANNKGITQLVGVKKAAPILFDLHNRLNEQGWFMKPFDDLTVKPVCKITGFVPNLNCTLIDSIYMPNSGPSKGCMFHRKIFTTKDQKYQVNTSCAELNEMNQTSRLVLPPLQAYYYSKNHSDYENLPPYRSDCLTLNEKKLALVFPPQKGEIYLPKNLNDAKEKVVFEASHKNSDATIYWYLNDLYLGTSQTFHTKNIEVAFGEHRLTIMDDQGDYVTHEFIVAEK